MIVKVQKTKHEENFEGTRALGGGAEEGEEIFSFKRINKTEA